MACKRRRRSDLPQLHTTSLLLHLGPLLGQQVLKCLSAAAWNYLLSLACLSSKLVPLPLS